MGDPTFSRFDRDPDALAWARGHVEAEIKRMRDWEQRAMERNDGEQAVRWRRHANLLQMKFVGGEGCVITAFDERKPVIVAALDEAPDGGESRG